jgi:hypothetical protein
MCGFIDTMKKAETQRSVNCAIWRLVYLNIQSKFILGYSSSIIAYSILSAEIEIKLLINSGP